MCWICTSIAARLKPCWPMKTMNRNLTAGTRIPLAARSLLKSWPSGCGTSAWNWGRRSLPLSYARPNLLLPMSPSRFTRTSLRSWRRTWLKARQYLRQCMDLPNGPVLPLLMAFLARRLPHNQMGRCSVLPTTPSIPKSGGLNEMVLCGSCMPHVLATVAPAPCVHSVKRAAPPSNRDE
jgi:hypothetical protein